MRVQHGELEFVFTLHAAFRVEERGIDGETLKGAVCNGEMESFGDGCVRISRKTKAGEIVLVGKKIGGNCVKIFTVEWRR